MILGLRLYLKEGNCHTNFGWPNVISKHLMINIASQEKICMTISISMNFDIMLGKKMNFDKNYALIKK